MKKLTVTLPILVLSGLVVFLAACATIMQGTKQTIGISSTPSGAFVDINGQSYGKTPLMAELARKNNHLIKIELLGYLPFEMHVTRKISGWVWGNVAFGGLVGLAVDVITGGLYRLTPEQVAATLVKQQGTSIKSKKDVLYVLGVLEPVPSWKKIGELSPSK